MTTGDYRAVVFMALVIVTAFFFLGYRAGVLNERERRRTSAKEGQRDNG